MRESQLVTSDPKTQTDRKYYCILEHFTTTLPVQGVP